MSTVKLIIGGKFGTTAAIAYTTDNINYNWIV